MGYSIFSHKSELLGRSEFTLAYLKDINNVLSNLNADGCVIQNVEYDNDGRFLIQYLTRDSAEVLKTVAEHEEKEQAIINSLVRDCSKALTNTVSEDIYCKVVNYGSGEVSKELSSSFFKRWYRDIQSISRAKGCFEVELENGEKYALSRL